MTTLESSGSHSDGRRMSKRRKLEVRPPVEDDDVYIVERILARSIEKTKLPSRRAEYLYLVRWEGYAPRDDTWEPESVVLDGAENLVRRFNARDHPFTILGGRGRDPRSYHIRFGLDSPGVASSPFYQEMWLTIPALKALKCVLAGGVDHIVKRFHAGKRGPMQAEDSGRGDDDQEQDEKTRQSRMTSEDSGGEQTDSDDSDTYRKARPKHHLIEVLERTFYKAKYNSANLTAEYCVTWRRGVSRYTHPTEEWFTRGQLESRFGRQATVDGIRRYNEKLRLEEEAASNTKPVVSEYESERMRRIQENRDMMKKLGLTI